jgi:hypothetical protein
LLRYNQMTQDRLCDFGPEKDRSTCTSRDGVPSFGLPAVKVTINDHDLKVEAQYPPYVAFAFTIEGGNASPHSDFVSLRTAQVLVNELGDGNAFMLMLFAIVNADPSEYDSLIGQTFED